MGFYKGRTNRYYCRFCKTTKKPLHKGAKSGIYQYYQCRDCIAKRIKKYRKTKTGKISTNRTTKKYHLKNINKYRAHYKLNYTLKRGKIKRGVCEICGLKRAVAHHDDYSKPLKVRWLCHLHHREWHKNN